MKNSSELWSGVAALAAAGSVATAAYAVAGRSSQLFGRSIYRGAGSRRSIALTFDDGPSEGTPALLEYLASENIKATFFQCGVNIQRHPAIARSVHDAGHEIGNHTFSHPRLCPRLGWKLNLNSPAFIYDQLVRTQEIIAAEAGVTPTLFRAPYGLRWIGLDAAQRRLSLLGVMWTVIGHDWEWTADKVAGFVLDRIDPGGIVCLHDGRDIQPKPDLAEMLAAVKRIVPALKQKGYVFETVGELLKPAAG